MSTLKATFLFINLFLLASNASTQITDVPALEKTSGNPGTPQQFAMITRFEVKEIYKESFHKALVNYASNAVMQRGNVMAEAFHEQDNPQVLWLIERWTRKADNAVFKKEEASMTVEGLYPMAFVQARQLFLIKDLEPLTKEEWRRVANSMDKPLTIMLFVDSKAGTEQNFKEVYHTAMPQFRSEPGVINYQLSQLESDKTQFVTYEKFRNEEAFQYHLTFPPIKPVIDYLNTSIKEQPFQKGLHRLIPISNPK